MHLRALCLLTGTLALAGCSSSANGPTPTKAPTNDPAATATAPAVTQQPASTATAGGKSSDGYAKGELALRRGNYSEAETDFRGAIAAGKNVAPAYAALGNAQLALRKYKEGYTSYKQAVHRDPRNADYLYGATYGALYSADYKDAITYATRLIKVRPKNAVAYHMRMLAYGRLIMPKLALGDAKAVARLQPHNAQAYNDLGIALANTQKYPQAVEAFTEAIKLQPNSYSFYNNRALAESRMKDYPATLADLKRARTYAPNAADKQVFTSAIKKLQRKLNG